MVNLIKNIQNFAFQNNLWEKDSKIVLGVSGGPDSVCLLDVFYNLADKYNFKLHIAHVNYGLRGQDSKQDEKFVRELGEKYGIAVSTYSPSKKEYQGNLENSLRKIRYEYFEEIRKELNFDLIAVAHNQDDQAETVLMRIIRGSGLNGLSAMKAKNRKIIRPLLGTSREEILNYLKQKKIKYRTDKTNADTKLMRNKIRHSLLPYLEKNFNPGIKKTLSEWSKTVADDYDFIEKSAERFKKNICKNKHITWDSKNFLALQPAMQKQLLRNIFHQLKKETLDIENKQIEEIIKVIKSTKNKTQKASVGGLKILKKGDKVDMFC